MTTKVIFAFGTGDSLSYHGSDRIATSIEFIPNGAILNDPNWKTFEIRADYIIPSDATTYACTTFVLPSFLNDVHIVKLEMILDPNTIQHVHHMILYRCGVPSSPWYTFNSDPKSHIRFQHRLNNTETCDTIGPSDSDTSACYEGTHHI